MITDTAKNVALSLEQLQQIETAKATLRNVETETLAAQKAYAVLQKDILKATKEKEYQEGLAEEADKNAREKVEELNAASTALTEARKELAALKEDENGIRASLSEREQELNAREASIAAAEKDLQAAKIEAANTEQTLNEHAAEVETARKAFQEAILTVTWS
jgi:chromosome segregation ATPase